jgi:hypothetical protein
MNRSNEMQTKQQIGNQVQLLLWQLPVRNHDAMVEFANNLFREKGMQSQEVFKINDNNNGKTPVDMVFTGISNAVSANLYGDEIWQELYSYKDQKHQEEVGATMQSDESAGQLLRQFMDLIRPGSCIQGQFGHVRVQTLYKEYNK